MTAMTGRPGVHPPWSRSKVEVDPHANLHHLESFKLPLQSQSQSPLFSLLPAEIRDLIYEYTFAEYEDLSSCYHFDTCYRRPDYMAPRKTDTALLRTCQSIYNDAWYLPWTSAQHTFFLTQPPRRPAKITTPLEMARACALIQKLHPDVSDQRKSIPHAQVFAQLFLIEKGALENILNTPYFMPRTITITIRHTDIWFWERDEPIRLGSSWISRCRFPSSVQKVRVQIESLERKKEQVDCITSCMQNEWYFTRVDDVHLVATSTASEGWIGSSTWQDKRWIRDEDDREPGVLHFYVVTVNFRPVERVQDKEGYERRQTFSFETLNVTSEIARRTRISSNKVCISTREMTAAGVQSTTPASEALRMVLEWHRRSQEATITRH